MEALRIELPPCGRNPPVALAFPSQRTSDQCCGKSKIPGRPTDHPWLMVRWSVSVLGGPSIIYWDNKINQRIGQNKPIGIHDTSTHRHADGFVQDCSISGALAMETLQSCAKPWIWYQCIYGVVCPLFFRNIFCKTQFIGRQTDHPWWDLGSPVGFVGRIWRPGDRVSAALVMRNIDVTVKSLI